MRLQASTRHLFLGNTRFELMIVALLALFAGVCFLQVRHLPFLRTTVYNLSDPVMFQIETLPGFVQQKPDAPALIRFRQHTSELVAQTDDEITKIVKIQHWVRHQESDEQFYRQPGRDPGPEVDNTEDPEKYLNQQRKGIHSACRRFSYILTGALLSQGIKARVVSIATDFDRYSPLSHNIVEAWVPKLNKWIVLDPTRHAFVLVDGAVASALEVHAAAKPESAKTVSLDQHGCHHRLPNMKNYRRTYRHVFVSRTNAVFDGYRYGLFATKKITFAHYCEPGIEPFPQQKKTILLGGFAASSSVTAFLLIRFVILLTVGLKDYKERIARALEIWGNKNEGQPLRSRAQLRSTF